MFLLLGAFIAGILTVLAPCVLPLLPIIIGGSVSGNAKDKKRPIIIAASLAISLIVFTLLLKATTLLINIPPNSINYFSGGIIVLLGLVTLFPGIYALIIAKLGIEQRTQKILGKGYNNKRSFIGPLITGAALGPVFSSCSPVYAYILATVLPANFAQAMVYIVAYVLGLSLFLLIIGYYGQGFIGKIKFAANPRGTFQRVIAVLFIVVGLSIATGFNVTFQTYISKHTPFDFDALSSKFLPKTKNAMTSNGLYNVKPYQAPNFVGLKTWINSKPLTIQSLRGKVVLVDFWTYSCINCIRNNPYLESWYKTYQKDGLVVIGFHAPEFSFEQIPANVEAAVKQMGLTYPIALDNNYATWNAFSNQSWPTSYLINPKGQVVRVHYGEGEYSQEEDAIRQLLIANGANVGNMMVANNVKVPVTANQTPETYLGIDKESDYEGTPALGAAASNTFTAQTESSLSLNNWTLGGAWSVSGQYVTSDSPTSQISIKVAAKNVYVVVGSNTNASAKVLINGTPIQETSDSGPDVTNGTVNFNKPGLYRIVSFPKFTSGATVTLQVSTGVELNVYTFGS
jgi:cytochrome c biogenesis protein CcdA/thiol-disulfide isomerase/thioredoxin